MEPSVRKDALPSKKQSFKATRNVSTFDFDGM